MEKNTFIHWEQAVNLNRLTEVAEQYKAKLLEINKMFTKNTLLQLTCMDLNFECMELLHPYFQKDYSKFLFDKTEQFFNKLEADPKVKETLEATPKFQEFARKLTEMMIEKNKTEDHENI